MVLSMFMQNSQYLRNSKDFGVIHFSHINTEVGCLLTYVHLMVVITNIGFQQFIECQNTWLCTLEKMVSILHLMAKWLTSTYHLEKELIENKK